MENLKTQITKDDILSMSRDELIDFLVENWSLSKQLPAGKEREYFLSRPGFHTMENMQGVALELICQ